MKIDSVHIRNYRRLKDVQIEFSPDTSLLVGPNNSGKSSAILAIQTFLGSSGRFRITDVTLGNLAELKSIGERWTSAAAEDSPPTSHEILNELSPLMPTVDLWINAAEKELGRFPIASPLLEDYPGMVGVRLSLEPRDPEILRSTFVAEYRKSAKILNELTKTEYGGLSLRPTDLVQYLEDRIGREFQINGYLLPIGSHAGDAISEAGRLRQTTSQDPPPPPECNMYTSSPNAELVKVDPALVRRLVRVDVISATREMSDADADGTSNRLSKIVGRYFTNHLNEADELNDYDLRAIHSEQKAIEASNTLASNLLRASLGEISGLGYPGGGNPSPIFESDRTFDVPVRQMFLRHKLGEDDSGMRNLDESLNGLGYQSLIYMIFCLMEFRQGWLKNGPAAQTSRIPNPHQEADPELGIQPIHLVLIEEPEAFLHAQVQQVFIKRALAVLRKEQRSPGHEDLHSQLVVSTHSSHIVQEIDFDSIRYIRRDTATSDTAHPVSHVRNLTSLFGDAETTARFVKRVVRVNHCNMLFADALILIEGAAERILLPEMLNSYSSLSVAYVEIMEVGGAHAHKLRQLVEALGVPTLVISDIDAKKLQLTQELKKDGTPKTGRLTKVRPELSAEQETGNPTLTSWLNRGTKLDDLMTLQEDDKIVTSGHDEHVRFAYQTPLGPKLQIIPSTFEDALALSNLTLLKSAEGEALLRKFGDIVRETDDLHEQASKFYDAIQGGSKTGFALDILDLIPDGANLEAPNYIAEGLQWLDAMVSRRGLISVVEEDAQNRERSTIAVSE